MGKTLQDGDPADSLQLDAWVQQMPQRSTTTKSVNADLVNLVFLGSREQVQAAFREAGWHNSDPVSRHSFDAESLCVAQQQRLCAAADDDLPA